MLWHSAAKSEREERELKQERREGGRLKKGAAGWSNALRTKCARERR